MVKNREEIDIVKDKLKKLSFAKDLAGIAIYFGKVIYPENKKVQAMNNISQAIENSDKEKFIESLKTIPSLMKL